MGTSQEPQTSDRTAGSSSTVDQAKRLPGQRGRSFGSKLVRMKSRERHFIHVDEYGRVVGPHYEEFATWIGVIVRYEANAPLMVRSFKDIPEDLKEKMYRCVQEKFVWDECVDLREMIISYLKKRYMDYRTNLKKKYYTPFDSDRDRIIHFKGLKHPPIQEETFLWLLRFWESDAHQELSRRNKLNRSKASDDAHRLGRESEAQFIYRETQRQGHAPHRVDVYIESRKGRHDGKFASVTAEQNSAGEDDADAP